MKKGKKKQNLLTPNACALMGNVVLQISLKGCLSTSLTNAAIVHQEEGLAAVVQTVGVMCRVLDVIPSWETSLQTSNTRNKESAALGFKLTLRLLDS